MAYALSAERIAGHDVDFLQANPACIPIFVSLLFQSLEISIKHAGIESGIFKLEEVKKRKFGNGHGIKEIGALIVERLGLDPFRPIVGALTYHNKGPNSAKIVRKMICAPELEKTRQSYAKRNLGYAYVEDKEFATMQPIPQWIDAVKETAANLPSAILILSQWKASASKSKHYAIWDQMTVGELDDEVDA